MNEKDIFERFRTAWSPLYDSIVNIKRVRKDEFGELILECSLPNDAEENVILFRTYELKDYWV